MYRFKTSPCVPAPRAPVETCARGGRFTRGRFESTHGDDLNLYTGERRGGREGAGSSPVLLTKFAHVGLSRAPEVHRKKPLDRTHFQFENRSRTTHSRALQSFALPDKAVRFQLS